MEQEVNMKTACIAIQSSERAGVAFLRGLQGFVNQQRHNHSKVEQHARNKANTKEISGKMVKVKDLRKDHDPDVLRFFLSTAHYRRPLTYSESAIEDAKANITHIKTAIANGYHRLNTAGSPSENDAKRRTQWEEYVTRFVSVMDDDFQTQNGITIIYEMIRDLNRAIEQVEISTELLEFMLNTLIELLSIFGLENLEMDEDLLDEEIDLLIQQREEARAAKDFEQADAIRDLLKEQGIILEDTNQGIRWKREQN